MIEELLKNNDCNVIFVDWENGAGYPFNQAFGDARVVGMKHLILIIITIDRVYHLLTSCQYPIDLPRASLWSSYIHNLYTFPKLTYFFASH